MIKKRNLDNFVYKVPLAYPHMIYEIEIESKEKRQGNF